MTVFDFLRTYQLDLMLIMFGICACITAFLLLTRTLPAQKRKAMLIIEISAMVLVFCDRLAYLYRGNTTTLGYWMVRVTNYLVFSASLCVLIGLNFYIENLCKIDLKMEKMPNRLRITELLVVVGLIMILLSQFTGLYYTFDEQNCYQRSDGYWICYIVPFISYVLQASVVIQNYRKLNRRIASGLLLFTIIPTSVTFVQFFTYGLSLTNIGIVLMSVVLYLFVLNDMNEQVVRANRIEIDYLKNEKQNMRRLFEQTAVALVNAIDAKDKYTHGHSSRVAEYSRKIAEQSGMSEEECEEVYFSALLHDVGKIGIPMSIITKNGKLTEEEYETIKQHPVIGEQILSSITEYPYLSIGAHYHHERYDGKGYPAKLKGDDIPEIARIVAVADAYDAMTSQRSYRDLIPQQQVREEIIKGTGTQFDPKYARIMQHLIDLDTEYQMKEKEEIKELAGRNELLCGAYKSEISEGIWVMWKKTTIRLKLSKHQGPDGKNGDAAFILFDSLDGRFHDNEKKIKALCYFEYGEILFSGKTTAKGARKIQVDFGEKHETDPNANYESYEIEAVRWRDHALFKFRGGKQDMDITVALPDSARYLYLGLTGSYCKLFDVQIENDEESIDENYITRIADEVSYIDVPAGDIPNVQIDGFRSDTSQGILIKDHLNVRFHAISLPTARLLWHCPFVILFASDDGQVNGENYREINLVRFDGEYWETDDNVENKLIVEELDDFGGWEAWKERNKSGIECLVSFSVKGNKITMETENGGIRVRNITEIKDMPEHVYASLTGDQVAITNIRIENR